MLKLCIFGDIHYIDKKPKWDVDRKLVEYADELTIKLVDKINNDIKPDVVINLGDMIQASKDIENDKKNIIHVCNILNKIKCPYYVLLGNHELKLVDSNKEILDLLNYKRATYSLDIDDYHLIFIGTENDLLWLEKDLVANKDKKIILFSHFGIAYDANIKDNFWCYSDDGENLMLRNRDKLKELIKDKNIIAVFCGHQHWTKKI